MSVRTELISMTTKALADFVADLQYDKLSPETVQITKQCILDWLGVCIRGSQEKPIKIIRKLLLEGGGKPQATVLAGDAEKTTTLNAAFCNGSASHSLDFDDLHNPSIIHLATVVVPPVFAIADTERKSGKEMLAAVVAGYEVGGRVGESVIPESYFFWHTTGTAGTFGAAASAAKILGLNATDTLQCLGSAGTQAAGLWEFLKEGAMSKTLHAGKSSYAGVLSAYLARAGFTGATKILEGEKGFCRAMVPEPHLEKLTDGLNDGIYKIDNNSFKPYACCKHSHASLYAMQVLRAENGLKSEDVEEIELLVNNITEFLINNPQPENPYGCKFSIQYCVAGMLKYGDMGVDRFLPEVIGDAEVRSVMAKTKVVRDPAIEAVHAADPAKLASKLVVRCKDGRVLEMQVDFPKGDPPNPMIWDESVAKFMSLAVPVYGEAKAAKLCKLIETLENSKDFAVDLAKCLA